MTDYPSELIEHCTIGDERLIVRPIRPDDAERHVAFFKRLAPEDVHYRFFAAMRELSPEQLKKLTSPDYVTQMAIIAAREGSNDTVAVARIAIDASGQQGEFAVAVQPDAKSKGIASHLMRRIMAWARTRGVREVVGEVLADNRPMLAFVRHLGFSLHDVPGNAQIVEARVTLDPADLPGEKSRP
jgi:acetyltransferase